MDRPGQTFLRLLSAARLAIGIAVAACASRDRNPAAAPAPPLDFIEIDAAGGGDADAPLVVAVHGLGDRPENLADLYRDISAPCSLVLPRAPIPYAGGSSWFDIDIPYAPDAALGARIAAAADRVAALIDHLKATRAIRGRPLVTGFSQGGMISFAVAVRHPGSVGVAVPLAGALPPSSLPAARAPKNAPRIRAFHGSADDLVPVDYARRTVDALRTAGYDASLREYAGVGHAVPDAMRRDALAAIEAAITSPPIPLSGAERGATDPSPPSRLGKENTGG